MNTPLSTISILLVLLMQVIPIQVYGEVLSEEREKGWHFVRPDKAHLFSKRQSCRGKSQNLVAWVAMWRETKMLKPTDKATFKSGERVTRP